MGGITTTLFQRPRDPNFNQTTLLLSGNFPTNGAQNNTFLDSSSNGFTITRNPSTGPNAPTQGTFSPFSQSPGAWSNFFGGTGSYASTSNTIIATTTTTFTIEGWIYPTATPVTGGSIPSVIADGAPAGAQLYWGFGPLANGTLSFYWYDGASKSATGNTTISLNTWTHIAVSVNANAITLYVNGVQQTLTGTTTLTNRSGTTGITAFAQFNSGGSYFTGYISNFSILSGTAKYSTSFTPSPAPLPTGTTNQVLLFAYANNFVDSNTATTAKTFTITASGTAGIPPPSVQPFSPFVPSGAYTTTAVGGSGYFDGTGDYLSVADNVALQFGSGNFTINCWIYRSAIGAVHTIASKGAATPTGWVFQVNASNQLVWTDTSTSITTTTTIPANTWTYVSVVRSGTGTNQTVLYINGVSSATGTSATNFNQTSSLNIGADRSNANNFNGYIAGIEYVKGTALSISVPTAPPTTTNSPSLLLNYTNAGITDATAKNVVETVGDAKISTAVSKFGGSSILFDGTGDYLNIPTTNQSLTLGSANWTVEFWIYLPSLPSARKEILYLNGNTSGFAALSVHICSNNKLGLSFSESGSAWKTDDTVGVGNALTATTWQHVAVTRNGQNIQVYLDGVSQGATYTTNAATSSLMTTYTLNQIATYNTSSFQLNAYIDDLRITVGVVRYTANFNVPTIGFTDR